LIDGQHPLPGESLQFHTQPLWQKRTDPPPFRAAVGSCAFINDAPYDWLKQTGVEGLVFLSGDRHHTELIEHTREGAYPLYELTCSALTSKPRKSMAKLESGDALHGTLVSVRNFCQLDFSGTLTHREVKIQVFDSTGQPLWQRTLHAAELTHR
jgi:hypothetical protein